MSHDSTVYGGTWLSRDTGEMIQCYCVSMMYTTRRVLGKDYIIKWTWLKTLKCIDCKVFPLLCWKIKFSEYVANRQQITWFKALKCKISENAVVFFWRLLVYLNVFAVCRGLIKNGERQDEESVGGRRRTEALRQLCQMNPSQALNIRAMVVSYTVNIITLKLHQSHT